MHTPTAILVTGGAGFIGANFVHYMMQRYPDIRIVTLDALTYAGSEENLQNQDNSWDNRHTFIKGNICDAALLQKVFADHNIDTVVHFAAESHVDRSIDGPDQFIETNIVGTYTLLQAARKAWGERRDVRFHHVSTDEVYGSLGDAGLFTETTAYDPSSPYSASKAASDHLVMAWHRTYGLPVTLSNCSNNYGPFQYPEKLLPVILFKAVQKESLPVYGKGENVRDWLYVVDHCAAIDTILRKARTGSIYNVGGHNEWKNIDVVKMLCNLLEDIRPSGLAGGYESLITFVTDRPGHDFRYAIDASKLEKELGWTPEETFETGLRKTILWYLENTEWLQSIAARNPSIGERLGL
jgi:dTDP-glucose 4,6-dehydratase